MTGDTAWKQRLAKECAEWALAFERSSNGGLDQDVERVRTVATLAVILALDTVTRRMEGDPAAFPPLPDDDDIADDRLV